MLKWSTYLCLLSILPLSSCTQLAPESDDVVLMPTMGKGGSRANKSAPEAEEPESPAKVNRVTDPTAKADMPAATPEQTRELDAIEQGKTSKPKKKSVNEPTPAQQEAAHQALATPDTTPSPSAGGVISQPYAAPRNPANPIIDEEDDAPVAPRPNSIELRGLRSPSLPNQLPMEVKS